MLEEPINRIASCGGGFFLSAISNAVISFSHRWLGDFSAANNVGAQTSRSKTEPARNKSERQ